MNLESLLNGIIEQADSNSKISDRTSNIRDLTSKYFDRKKKLVYLDVLDTAISHVYNRMMRFYDKKERLKKAGSDCSDSKVAYLDDAIAQLQETLDHLVDSSPYTSSTQLRSDQLLGMNIITQKDKTYYQRFEEIEQNVKNLSYEDLLLVKHHIMNTNYYVRRKSKVDEFFNVRRLHFDRVLTKELSRRRRFAFVKHAVNQCKSYFGNVINGIKSKFGSGIETPKPKPKYSIWL